MRLVKPSRETRRGKFLVREWITEVRDYTASVREVDASNGQARMHRRELTMTQMRRWEMDAIGRDRLTLREVPIPRPASGEVLVRVAACRVELSSDKMVVESGRDLPLTFPFTPGSDFAGTVVRLGDNVFRFGEGDRVISTFTPDWVDGLRPGDARTPAYRTLGGFYPGVLAEYVAVPQEWLVRAPTH